MMDVHFNSRCYGLAKNLPQKEYDLQGIADIARDATACARPKGDPVTFAERHALVLEAGYQELTGTLRTLVELKFQRFAIHVFAVVMPDVAVAALAAHNNERQFDYVERWSTDDHQKEGKLVGILVAPHGAHLRFPIVEWNTNGVPLLSVEEMQTRYFEGDRYTPEGKAYFDIPLTQADDYVYHADGTVEYKPRSPLLALLRSLSPVEKSSIALLFVVATLTALRSDSQATVLVSVFCTGAVLGLGFTQTRSFLCRTYSLAASLAVWVLLLINTFTFEAEGTVCGISHDSDGSRSITLRDGRRYDLHNSARESSSSAILGQNVTLEVHNLIGDWFQYLPGGHPRYVKDLSVTGSGNNC